MPAAEAPQRAGRAWSRLRSVGLVPEYERDPAAGLLYELADREVRAHHKAGAGERKSRRLGTLSVGLTVLALVLAGTAGFAGLSDVAGARTAGVIALVSAAVSGVSAWVQAKVDGLGLRLESIRWRHHSDDINQSVVVLMSRLPMDLDAFRSAAEDALNNARAGDPERQDSESKT